MLRNLLSVTVASAMALSFAAGTAAAMSNGDPVSAGSAPWFAAVQFREGASVDGTVVTGDRLARNHCGGALIDPRTVLTAAHCVTDPAFARTDPRRRLAIDSFRVILGDRSVSDVRSPELRVSHITVDPDFALVPSPKDPDNLDTAGAANDLALITLTTAIPHAQTIRVSVTPGVPGTSVSLFGHGLVPDGNRSDPLLRGALSVISAGACARLTFVNPRRANVICAQSRSGRPSVQAGFGDSGGPVSARDAAGTQRLLGIFSFGTETTNPLFTPGFNAAGDVRLGALRWAELRAHLHT